MKDMGSSRILVALLGVFSAVAALFAYTLTPGPSADEAASFGDPEGAACADGQQQALEGGPRELIATESRGGDSGTIELSVTGPLGVLPGGASVFLYSGGTADSDLDRLLFSSMSALMVSDTNEEGECAFNNVPLGDWIVRVLAKRSRDTVAGAYPAVVERVSLSGKRPQVVLNVMLEPGSYITGTLVDVEGEAVEGREVYVRHRGLGALAGAGLSGLRGEYRLGPLCDGQYLVGSGFPPEPSVERCVAAGASGVELRLPRGQAFTVRPSFVSTGEAFNYGYDLVARCLENGTVLELSSVEAEDYSARVLLQAGTYSLVAQRRARGSEGPFVGVVARLVAGEGSQHSSVSLPMSQGVNLLVRARVTGRRRTPVVVSQNGVEIMSGHADGEGEFFSCVVAEGPVLVEVRRRDEDWEVLEVIARIGERLIVEI